MKIHTDNLTSADLHGALKTTGLAARGVYLDWDRPVSVHRSRSRHHRIDFYLIADEGHGRRYGNSGNSGSLERGGMKAATYFEWGAFIAELFHRDPTAVIGHYTDPENFVEAAGSYRPRNVPGPEAMPETVEEWRTLFIPDEHELVEPDEHAGPFSLDDDGMTVLNRFGSVVCAAPTKTEARAWLNERKS